VDTIVLADTELSAVGEQKRAQGTETDISPSGYASMPDVEGMAALNIVVLNLCADSKVPLAAGQLRPVKVIDDGRRRLSAVHGFI